MSSETLVEGRRVDRRPERSRPACLSDDDLVALGSGRMWDDELARAEQHLVSCGLCRAILAESAVAARHDSQSATRPIEVDDSVALVRGTSLGRYVVEDLIGSGGLGLVYGARDPELHRRVALKIMRSNPTTPSDAEHRARSLREARAMAQINHPNVVQVYDVGMYRDRVFLAMELVEGTTLRRWLTSAPRSRADIVEVFRAAAAGLSAAHTIGIVHRDFKPENVLVGHDGRVRVTDFGLAQAIDWHMRGTAADSGAPMSWHSDVTRTGVLAGTPAYMAPEQFGGRPADPRSDQFAFCVALYEAVYGERPFTGETVEQIANAIVAGVMPPRRETAQSSLHDLIARGLAARPDDRYPNMPALLEALAAVEPSAPRARAVSRRRKTGTMIAALGSAIVVAAFVIIGLRDATPEHAILPAVSAERSVNARPPAPMVAPAPSASTALAQSAETMAVAAAPPVMPRGSSVPARKRLEAKRRATSRPHANEPAQGPEPRANEERVGEGLKDPFARELGRAP